MSLLLREQLYIGLAPERLTALRAGGRLRPGIRDRYTLALNASDDEQWGALTTALEIFLDQPAWRACDLTVILSSHYVHYVVIPGGRRLDSSGQNDLARIVFRDTFGELIHDWELRVNPFGNLPTLSSAVPRSLLKMLRDVCDGRGRLRSIQPGLMTIFNHIRAHVGEHSGTLALIETGRIVLAAIVNGQWHSVLSRAGPSHALNQLLEDESDLLGRRAGGLLWLCDLTGEAQLPSSTLWQVKRCFPQGGKVNGVTTLVDWGLG